MSGSDLLSEPPSSDSFCPSSDLIPFAMRNRTSPLVGVIGSLQWLELIGKCSLWYCSSGFSHRPPRMVKMLFSTGESAIDSQTPLREATHIGLWEVLSNAAMLDLESSCFLGTSFLHFII